MRILQLHDEIWDSGIAHYALTLSEELARRNHQVQFWAPAGSYAARKARELELNVVEIDKPWFNLPRLRRLVQEGEIDVIDAHTGSAQSLAAALAFGTKIPLVRTRGDTRPAASHTLAKFLASRTQAFVAVNSRIHAELSQSFPHARVELVYPGIFSPPLVMASLLPQTPIVGLLGRLDPVKGHDDLLDAAVILHPKYPEAQFLAAGADTGKGERQAKLQWQTSYLKLDKAVKFLGHVPDAREFIARCRIGVIASTGSEAVSRACLEWMALGRPVVATKVGCLPDLVLDGQTGFLVPPGQPQALAEALGRLMENPAQAAAMGAKGKERFQQFFTLKRLAAETENLYSELIRDMA